MNMSRPSLEFMIKFLVSGLALGVTLLITGTALYVDYQDKIKAETEQIRELTSLISNLTASETSLLLAKVGEDWTLLAQSDNDDPEGIRFETIDGASWNVSLDRGKIFSAMLLRQRHILVVGMIGLLLSVEIAVFLAYSLTRPLKAIAWACREIRGGKWVHVPERGPRTLEIQTLQDTFNGMVDELAQWKTVERRVARIERLAALGQLIAGVSHEIRNPLASMRIHLDLLAETVPIEGQSSMAIIDQELDRLNGTVGQLLSYARPSSPVKGPVRLQELFHWCHRMVRVQLLRDHIRWVQHLQGDNLSVWGDQGQLQQMLLNLVLNATRAMKETGGTLEISAEPRQGDTLLSISDTGPGIPEALADRVFDPFVTSYADGTGLGLSMVLQIVEMHQGRIEIDSQNTGTLFRVFLPTPQDGGDMNNV